MLGTIFKRNMLVILIQQQRSEVKIKNKNKNITQSAFDTNKFEITSK